MGKASLDLIEAMQAIAEQAQPITGRGIGYKLFTVGLIPSMETTSMQQVYRLLRIAREEGIIPWRWIVDENRDLERVQSWSNPAEFVQAVADPIGATSGSNSHFALKYGAKREPSAAPLFRS